MTDEITSNWICHFEPSAWKKDGDLWLGIRRENGATDLVTGFQFVRVEEGMLGPGPSVDAGSAMIPRGNTRFLQAVLDEAWRHGLRPTGHDSSQTEFDALSRHLEDMRAIAFHGLGAMKP